MDKVVLGHFKNHKLLEASIWSVSRVLSLKRHFFIFSAKMLCSMNCNRLLWSIMKLYSMNKTEDMACLDELHWAIIKPY